MAEASASLGMRDFVDQLRSDSVRSVAIGGRVLNLQGVKQGVPCDAARQADPYVAPFRIQNYHMLVLAQGIEP